MLQQPYNPPLEYKNSLRIFLKPNKRVATIANTLLTESKIQKSTTLKSLDQGSHSEIPNSILLLIWSIGLIIHITVLLVATTPHTTGIEQEQDYHLQQFLEMDLILMELTKVLSEIAISWPHVPQPLSMLTELRALSLLKPIPLKVSSLSELWFSVNPQISTLMTIYLTTHGQLPNSTSQQKVLIMDFGLLSSKRYGPNTTVTMKSLKEDGRVRLSNSLLVHLPRATSKDGTTMTQPPPGLS